jgi:glycosyltransferase involved in cell wall biosynthesis
MVSRGLSIIVVVPCYNVEDHIVEVVETMPDYVGKIILVNDCSRDQTGELIESLSQGNVIAIHLPQNRGVGGAMLEGFAKASELDADIIVKMDGDGQMDPDCFARLVEPLVLGKADYAKGNRFRHALLPSEMPTVRQIGNAALSFLNKLASGYWNVFDPTNGYLAVRREIVEMLPHKWIHRRYFFESSLLIALGILGAVVIDVPIAARYGLERSNLRIAPTLFEFPLQLGRGILRRIWYRKIIYSLTMEAVLGIFGTLLFCAGLAYGLFGFIKFSVNQQTSAPAGVVMGAALLILLGLQMILNAILLDIQSVPTNPLCEKYQMSLTTDVETQKSSFLEAIVR